MGHRQGNRAEGGQPIIQSGRSIMLRSDALLHDLALLLERHLDANREEGLEQCSQEDRRHLLPAEESVGRLQLRDERQQHR